MKKFKLQAMVWLLLSGSALFIMAYKGFSLLPETTIKELIYFILGGSLAYFGGYVDAVDDYKKGKYSSFWEKKD